jgi:hypothetical protein
VLTKFVLEQHQTVRWPLLHASLPLVDLQTATISLLSFCHWREGEASRRQSCQDLLPLSSHFLVCKRPPIGIRYLSSSAHSPHALETPTRGPCSSLASSLSDVHPIFGQCWFETPAPLAAPGCCPVPSPCDARAPEVPAAAHWPTSSSLPCGHHEHGMPIRSHSYHAT